MSLLLRPQDHNGINNPELIVNRIKIDMVRRGDMMSVEDVKEILLSLH